MKSFDGRAIGLYARVTSTGLMICGFVALGAFGARALMRHHAPLWQAAVCLTVCVVFGLVGGGRELYRIAEGLKKERDR